MEPEARPTPTQKTTPEQAADADLTPAVFALRARAQEYRRLRQVFIGNQGLRGGWIALMNLCLVLSIGWALYSVAAAIHPFKIGDLSPVAIGIQVAILYLAIYGSNLILGQVRARGLRWALFGSQGLRAGWSVAIFVGLFLGLIQVVGRILVTLFPVLRKDDFSPGTAALQELIPFLAMVGAAAIVAFMERRRIRDYNLAGPKRGRHFFGGLAAGFAALSLLVGALAWGGWLHFGAVALSGAAILQFGALWGCCFLLVGCVEEGTFRCYLQFTLTRGINFWWALACVGGLCLRLLVHAKGNGVWGVYAIALLGLIPCWRLHKAESPGAGFWQAAWVTSTLFGFVHTSNNGENWIGIFAAALIGFVFCVSVRVTGSAWWAIGCHASWDWAETYFYGTADSGFVAKGHYLTSTPAGATLWSGGTDGPEGSLLVIPVVLLLLVVILALYGRKKRNMVSDQALEQALG